MAKKAHKIALIRWAVDVMPGGGIFHVARRTYTAGTRLLLHRHDFAELFWIERGRARHTINGKTEVMDTGSLVFIRPQDRHSLGVLGSACFTLVNIAMPVEVLAPIRKCYFAEDRDVRWPWRDTPMPRNMRLTSSGLDRLSGWADQLAAMSQARLELDAFLLDLFNLIEQTASPWASLPDWLAQAIGRMNAEDELSGGPARLAEIAHRSPEHINRTLRKHLNQTTSELINELRLERAARLLRMTNRPIIEVAHACGIDHLGYFYRLFKRRFGHPPRRYRIQQQAPVR